MILHAYCSTYNDLYMVKFYVRYYSQFASKIFVYDDESTDGTREFLESCSPLVEVKSPGFHGIDEVLLENMRENEYKKFSRGIADWVIIGDSDEFVYCKILTRMLSDLVPTKAIHAIRVQAYQMFAEKRPEGEGQITDYVKTGIRDPMYDRLIFRPEFDMKIPPGMHYCEITNPGEHAILEHVAIKMLHYKYIGREHVTERHNRVWSRSSDRNKERGWGIHNSPQYQDKYGLKWYEEMLGQAKPII